MTDEEMIEALRKRGYSVQKRDIVTYNVTISFAGFVGSQEDVEVDAPKGADDEEILSRLIDDYIVDDYLSVESVEKIDDDEYSVTINFAGYYGLDNEYTVYADDEDEAIEQALEEAKYDIVIDSFEEVGE